MSFREDVRREFGWSHSEDVHQPEECVGRNIANEITRSAKAHFGTFGNLDGWRASWAHPTNEIRKLLKMHRAAMIESLNQMLATKEQEPPDGTIPPNT